MVRILPLRDSALLWKMHGGLKEIASISQMKQFDEVISRSGEVLFAAQFGLAKEIFQQIQHEEEVYMATISRAYTKIQGNV